MSDAIKHLTKPITIIDIFGMLLPGCTAVFLLQNQGVPLGKPVVDFFGTEANFLIRLFYLFGLGYLLGSAIHDLSGVIAHGLEFVLLKIHLKINQNANPKANQRGPSNSLPRQDIWDNPAFKNTYQTLFKTAAPANDEEKVLAGMKIYRYLQTQPAEISAKLDLSKISLFAAFSSMGRSMALVCLVAAIGFLTTTSSIWLTGIAIIMTCIFLYRWRHFQKCALQYAYLAILTLVNSTQNSPIAVVHS